MFVVAKRFGRIETRLKEFSKQPEAESFIMEKLREDIQFKLMATYCLYEGADILREYTQMDVATPTNTNPSEDSSDTPSSQGKGSGKSFAPTPFSTTPRLGPQSWIKDDEDKDKDEEK